jgi:hypothetical protein
MNIIYKFYVIYFIIILPVLSLNNQTSITSLQMIDTVNIYHTFKVPYIIKIWLFMEILQNLL